jgi:SHAQKYF class myb-like DNA-binding protein
VRNESTAFSLPKPVSQQNAVNDQCTKRKRKKTKRALDRIPEMCQGGKWTAEEHNRFLTALDIYGNTWEKVEDFIGTRSRAQIRSHAQKYFRGMRARILSKLKKTGQLKKAIFIVVREYRNYTYCQHPSTDSMPDSYPGNFSGLGIIGSSTEEEFKEEIQADEGDYLYINNNLEEEQCLRPEEATHKEFKSQEQIEHVPFLLQNLIPEPEYAEAQCDILEEKRPFWVDDNENVNGFF